mmetsp:Transcript_24104/g.36620  ORF Transcript_24104/g.36620 Transcript_24104/m.36620 type:complete len:268 (+) Transcript_24104:283-1086(+)
MTNKLGRLGFSFRFRNDGLLFLFSSQDDVLCSLSFLLSNLLRFNSSRIFRRKGQMGNGHIIQDDVEESGSSSQINGNFLRNHVTLRQKLIGIIARHNRLGALVHDAGKHPFVVVDAQLAVDPNQPVRVRLVQDTNGDGHHLQILGTRQSLQIHGAGTDVEDHGAFEPRNVEIQTFSVHRVLHTYEAIENDGAVTSLDGIQGVHRSVGEASSDGQGCHATGGRRGGAATTTSTTAATAGSGGLVHLLCNLLKGITETLCHLVLILLLV